MQDPHKTVAPVAQRQGAFGAPHARPAMRIAVESYSPQSPLIQDAPARPRSAVMPVQTVRIVVAEKLVENINSDAKVGEAMDRRSFRRRFDTILKKYSV